MPTLKVKHEGGMASSIHVRGHELIADVPPAMGGEDRGPTPVDLLAGSLGSCIVFYVANWCKQAGIAAEGFEVEVEYELDMQAHCVPVLRATLTLPKDFPAERRDAVLKVASKCTVHNTLCRIPQLELNLAE